MKRQAIAIGIGLSLLGLVPGLASASTFTLDQSNNNFDHLLQSANIDAQTFTAGMYGPLDSVELYLSPSPHGTVSVTVQGTTGSPAVPNGTVLASKTLGIPASPSGSWFRFSFSTEPILTVGHVYAIVILPTDNVSIWGSKMDDYGGGRALAFSGGSWISPWNLPSPTLVSDWAFKTNMGPAAATPTPTHRATPTPTHRPSARPTATHAPSVAPTATPTATPTAAASATDTPTPAAATATPVAIVAGVTGAPAGDAQNPGSASGSASGGSGGSATPIVIVAIVALLLLLGGLAFLLMRRRQRSTT